MERKKVLFVTHEMTPYLEMTELADSARELPQFIQENGHETRVFMPRFGDIKERKHRLHEVIRLSGINIPVGDDDNPLIIKVASLPSAKMQIYFLDNEDFFHKRGVFSNENGPFYDDNDARMIFFNKGIVEIILKLGWIPDIIHCMGWMSSLLPVYIRNVHKNESIFRNTKVVFSVLENGFDSNLGKGFAEKAMVPGQAKESLEHLDNPTCSDLYVAGITFADGIIVGSDNIDDDVRAVIAQTDKPVLSGMKHGTPNFAENHYEFYQSLLEQGVLEGRK